MNTLEQIRTCLSLWKKRLRLVWTLTLTLNNLCKLFHDMQFYNVWFYKNCHFGNFHFLINSKIHTVQINMLKLASCWVAQNCSPYNESNIYIRIVSLFSLHHLIKRPKALGSKKPKVIRYFGSSHLMLWILLFKTDTIRHMWAVTFEQTEK